MRAPKRLNSGNHQQRDDHGRPCERPARLPDGPVVSSPPTSCRRQDAARAVALAPLRLSRLPGARPAPRPGGGQSPLQEPPDNALHLACCSEPAAPPTRALRVQTQVRPPARALGRYVRFDTRKPAQNRGLPLTSVISRYDLLDLLVQRCQEISPDLLVQGVEARSVWIPFQRGALLSCSAPPARRRPRARAPPGLRPLISPSARPPARAGYGLQADARRDGPRQPQRRQHRGAQPKEPPSGLRRPSSSPLPPPASSADLTLTPNP